MGKIRQIANNLANLNIDDEVDNILLRKEKLIVSMNKEQLRKGKRSDGYDVGLLLSEEYAEEKIESGGQAPFGNADMFNHGNFFKGFYIDLGNTAVDIRSSDEKEGRLINDWGENIFGLNPSNTEILSEGTGKELGIVIRNAFKV